MENGENDVDDDYYDTGTRKDDEDVAILNGTFPELSIYNSNPGPYYLEQDIESGSPGKQFKYNIINLSTNNIIKNNSENSGSYGYSGNIGYHEHNGHNGNSEYNGHSGYSSSVEDNRYKLIKKRIDKNKVRNKRNIIVNSGLAKDIVLENNVPVRAGCIVYTKHNEETLFCLGEDATFGDLTDFGGGVKKNETVIEGGLRELFEESQGVFGNLEPVQAEEAPAVYSSDLAIIFIPMMVDIDMILKEFNNKIAFEKNMEVRNIAWLSKEELIDSINGRGKRIYARVREVLKEAIDLISRL